MPATPPTHQSKNCVVLLEPPPLVLVRSFRFSFRSHAQKSNPLQSKTGQFFFRAFNRASHVSLFFSNSGFIPAPQPATDCVATRPTRRMEGAGVCPPPASAAMLVQRPSCSARVACETTTQGVSGDKPFSS